MTVTATTERDEATMSDPARIHEPTLSQVHTDLVGRLDHDKRIRDLEAGQAATVTQLSGISGELRGVREDGKATRAELLAAIRENRPEPPWKAMTAMLGLVTLVFLIAGAIYTGNAG